MKLTYKVMEYKKYTSFLEGVENNDLLMVKSQLSEMVMLFQGDENEIMQAVAYAEKKCEFKFDIHKETEAEMDKSSNSDMFYTEKSELISNFSKKRFLEVIRLYPLMVKEDNFFENNNEKEDDLLVVKTDSGYNSKNLKIGVIVIVSAIILYKLLK